MEDDDEPDSSWDEMSPDWIDGDEDIYYVNKSQLSPILFR